MGWAGNVGLVVFLLLIIFQSTFGFAAKGYSLLQLIFAVLITQHNNLVNLIFPVEFQLIGIIINFDM